MSFYDFFGLENQKTFPPFQASGPGPSFHGRNGIFHPHSEPRKIYIGFGTTYHAGEFDGLYSKIFDFIEVPKGMSVTQNSFITEFPTTSRLLAIFGTSFTRGLDSQYLDSLLKLTNDA